MATHQGKSGPSCCASGSRCARGRRPRARVCLRKGCGCKYQPRRWNQRYCQAAECLREVRRWQAARRQAARREATAAKAQHAQAERARRDRARSVRAAAAAQEVPCPDVTPARGHAAEAAEDFFRRRFATGQAATNRHGIRCAIRPGIAAPPAARRCAKCWTVNASGVLATRWRAASNGPTSTKPRANFDPRGAAKPLPKRGRGLRRNDAATCYVAPRRSSLIAWRSGTS